MKQQVCWWHQTEQWGGWARRESHLKERPGLAGMAALMVQSLTKTDVVLHLGCHNQTAQHRPGSVTAEEPCWKWSGRQICSCEGLQQQWHVGSWAVSTGAFLAEIETRASHCSQHSSGCSWNAVPSYGPHNSRTAQTGEGPRAALEDDQRRTCPMRGEWRN